jgi:4'-phosphopantetheinyl transferase EntD
MSMSEFEGLLPSQAVSVVSHQEAWGTKLFEEEAAFVQNAVPSRVKEFAAGRNCARQALRQIGVPFGPILVGRHREPLFPDDVSGTITHTQGICAAAVIHKQHGFHIGIDAEKNAPLDLGEMEYVLSKHERASLDQSRSVAGLARDRLIFSVKESFFKAFHQLVPVYIDFAAVRVDLLADQSQCRIDYLGNEKCRDFPQREFVALYRYDEKFIYSAVSLPSPKETPIYSQPLPTASIVETFLLQAHTT